MTLENETVGRQFDVKPAKGMTTTCTDCGDEMPFEVQRSAAGYYLGFWCKFCGPYSRESDYFDRRADAQKALESGEYDVR